VSEPSQDSPKKTKKKPNPTEKPQQLKKKTMERALCRSAYDTRKLGLFSSNRSYMNMSFWLEAVEYISTSLVTNITYTYFLCCFGILQREGAA